MSSEALSVVVHPEAHIFILGLNGRAFLYIFDLDFDFDLSLIALDSTIFYSEGVSNVS